MVIHGDKKSFFRSTKLDELFRENQRKFQQCKSLTNVEDLQLYGTIPIPVIFFNMVQDVEAVL